jgi:FixJ family two-component response regulator
MDGFEVHTLLQASGRDIPTVFISAHDDERYKEKARSVGGVTFLSKPCDESLLRGAIDLALAEWSVNDRLPSDAPRNK